MLDHRFDAALIDFWPKAVALICFIVTLGIVVAARRQDRATPYGRTIAHVDRERFRLLLSYTESGIAGQPLQ